MSVPLVPLKEIILEIKDGGTPSRKDASNFGGEIHWCVVKDIRPNITHTTETLTTAGLANCSAKVWPIGSIIISLGATIGLVGIARVPTATKQGLAGIVVDSKKVNPEYLAHYLRFRRSEIQSFAKGTTIKEVRPNALAERLVVPLPSLAEQQRIVAILDETFGGIAATASRTEAALENAVSLSAATIESLAASNGSNTSVRSVGELIAQGVLERISDGNHGEIHPTKDEFVPQGVPFVMASDLRGGRVDQEGCRFISEDRARSLRVGFARDGDVLLSHKGTIGRVAILSTGRPYVMLTPQVTYYRVKDRTALLPQYLYYALRGRKFQEQLREIADLGSTRAYIGITRQLDLLLTIPSVREQERLATIFDQVDREAQLFERVLTGKLTLLAELKQSLLARAFSGELTGKAGVANDNVFATSEQAANILAFMHWRHERANRNRFFGHVMAQKSLDLVERVGGVELGRRPYKDAAGPNDKPHMAGAEIWAKEHQFFEFVERPGGGYDFKKLANHGAMLSAAKTALKPVEAELGQVANILVGKDKVQAEIFATVLAAWNNLIIDGKDATEAAILREARDDWHPDKIDLPITKFQDAIREIRRLNLVPDGSAKAVRHKQAALF